METQLQEYFSLAIEKELLRFTFNKNWLTVEYQENLGYRSEDGTKWSLVCAQDISEYKDSLELCSRITLMLAEGLRSTKQDVNGLMADKRRIR